MSRATTLYTPEVLGLATGLASYPFDSSLPLHGSARAPLCGSMIEIGLELDQAGRIARLGLKSHACAIGQASAALFARSAETKNRDELEMTLAALERWLSDSGAPEPDWPGLGSIAAARAYPARHGAILLPWKAALAALS